MISIFVYNINILDIYSSLITAIINTPFISPPK